MEGIPTSEALFTHALSVRSGLARHGEDTTELDQLDGVLATLNWALGRSLAPPVTYHPTTNVQVADLHGEHAITQDMLIGRRVPDPRGRTYLIAVSDTLAWITRDTNTPPV